VRTVDDLFKRPRTAAGWWHVRRSSRKALRVINGRKRGHSNRNRNRRRRERQVADRAFAQSKRKAT